MSSSSLSIFCEELDFYCLLLESSRPKIESWFYGEIYLASGYFETELNFYRRSKAWGSYFVMGSRFPPLLRLKVRPRFLFCTLVYGEL